MRSWCAVRRDVPAEAPRVGTAAANRVSPIRKGASRVAHAAPSVGAAADRPTRRTPTPGRGPPTRSRSRGEVCAWTVPGFAARHPWHSDSMPELNQPDETEPTELEPTELEPTELESTELEQTEEHDDNAPATVRDNWWWSPAVALVIGVVVVMLQAQSLTGSGGHLLNWVVAGLGVALAASGVVRLAREYPR